MSNANEIVKEIAHGLRQTIASGSINVHENYLWWLPDNSPPSQAFGVTIAVTVEDSPYFKGIKYTVYSGNAIRKTKKIKSTKKHDNRVRVIETFLLYVEELKEQQAALAQREKETQNLQEKIQKDIGPHSFNITFMPHDENECFMTIYHQILSFDQVKRIVDIVNENGD